MPHFGSVILICNCPLQLHMNNIAGLPNPVPGDLPTCRVLSRISNIGVNLAVSDYWRCLVFTAPSTETSQNLHTCISITKFVLMSCDCAAPQSIFTFSVDKKTSASLSWCDFCGRTSSQAFFSLWKNHVEIIDARMVAAHIV